jgi:uncharacterized damage-inducible protein DinB
MTLQSVRLLLDRDLNRLKNEIELYKSEEKIWSVEKEIANSAGNLCLHLIGNLKAYIGAEIGKSGYIRQRELEFSTKNVTRDILVKQVEETIVVIHQSLDKISEEDLQKEFPLQVFEESTSIEFFLMHLTTHLAYHLGQINYHRRLLDMD